MYKYLYAEILPWHQICPHLIVYEAHTNRRVNYFLHWWILSDVLNLISLYLYSKVDLLFAKCNAYLRAEKRERDGNKLEQVQLI